MENIDAYYQAAVHHRWAVAALYIDKGLQHGNKYQKMRQNCMERKCHAVIVHDVINIGGEMKKSQLDIMPVFRFSVNYQNGKQTRKSIKRSFNIVVNLAV